LLASRLAGFVLLAGVVTGVGGCGGGGGSPADAAVPPVFPDDYAGSYQEVRNCRYSLEHDSLHIRILASPDALAPYRDRVAPFPTGAVVLKEQYGENDDLCAGPIVSFTVMQKLDVGSAPTTLDWTWQKVTPDFHTYAEDIKRCTQCHTDCGKPPEGYDGTCAVP
jgi:hypothetical protein